MLKTNSENFSINHSIGVHEQPLFHSFEIYYADRKALQLTQNNYQF